MREAWEDILFFAAGWAAASKNQDEDGADTPTGSNQSGQPPAASLVRPPTGTLVPVCFACGFIGPNDPRLPCHICGDNPWGRGSERPRYACRWHPTSVWWKPISWCSGVWLPIHDTATAHIEEQILAVRAAEHELSRARLERARDRFGTLDSWEE